MSVGSPDRITALEHRMAQLEQLAQAEQLTPNYLTLSPDGTIGALFSGGVQMGEGAAPGYTASSSLGWLDATTGVVREYIQGHVLAGQHNLLLRSSPDANDLAQITASARAAGGAGSALTATYVQDSSGASAAATILDSTGASGFLQLPTTQKLHLEYGATTATLAIGDNFTTITLSTSYTFVYPFFTVLAANTDALANQALSLTGLNSFQIDLHSTAIQNVTIYWLALGTG